MMRFEKDYFTANIYLEFIGKGERKDNRLVDKWRGFDVGIRLLIEKNGDAVKSIKVDREMIEAFDISMYEAFDIARKNSPNLFPPKIIGLQERMAEMMPGFVTYDSEEEIVFVLSNKEGFKGAVAIMYPDIFRTIRKRIKGNFYIIPSSVHELLLVKAESGITPEELNAMVCEVNAKEVELDEQLGDEVLINVRNTEIVTYKNLNKHLVP